MLELIFCSLVTILPDYLYRHYRQGKRFGREITLYSVWFELRWGITGCLLLTVAMIAAIFYYHPSTSSVVLYYRTVPIVPEVNGRVAEIYVGLRSKVVVGQPIFRLDSATQEAAVEKARRAVAETDAALALARTDLKKADAQIQEAQSAEREVQDELATKRELQRRTPGNVAQRDIERLEVRAEGQHGTLAAALANKESAEERIATVIPAQRASAEAALAQAKVELEKTVVRAGVNGRVEQFALRVGDIVNPFMRPAGILIPDSAGQRLLVAAFGQIETQVLRVGMFAEVSCASKPWTVIPMVVTEVQDFIASGQFRVGEQLIDPQQVRPGSILVGMEPLFAGGLDGIVPGSSCVANAYSEHHDTIADKNTGFFHGLALHAVDALGLVHALLLRVQTLLFPFQTLVFSGH